MPLGAWRKKKNCVNLEKKKVVFLPTAPPPEHALQPGVEENVLQNLWKINAIIPGLWRKTNMCWKQGWLSLSEVERWKDDISPFMPIFFSLLGRWTVWEMRCLDVGRWKGNQTKHAHSFVPFFKKLHSYDFESNLQNTKRPTTHFFYTRLRGLEWIPRTNTVHSPKVF